MCPRGWSGSGSSPRGAEPELIVSAREQGEHVCNPVGLSAERPGLSSLIDRMEKLQAKPGHNGLKAENHLQQCLNDNAADLSLWNICYVQRSNQIEDCGFIPSMQSIAAIHTI